jgi:hypothetical protein
MSRLCTRMPGSTGRGRRRRADRATRSAWSRAPPPGRIPEPRRDQQRRASTEATAAARSRRAIPAPPVRGRGAAHGPARPAAIRCRPSRTSRTRPRPDAIEALERLTELGAGSPPWESGWRWCGAGPCGSLWELGGIGGAGFLGRLAAPPGNDTRRARRGDARMAGATSRAPQTSPRVRGLAVLELRAQHIGAGEAIRGSFARQRRTMASTPGEDGDAVQRWRAAHRRRVPRTGRSTWLVIGDEGLRRCTGPLRSRGRDWHRWHVALRPMRDRGS